MIHTMCIIKISMHTGQCHIKSFMQFKYIRGLSVKFEDTVNTAKTSNNMESFLFISH